MLRILTFGLLFGASAAAQPMPVDDDCAVSYREEASGTAPVSTGLSRSPASEEIARLEKRYVERPNSRAVGAELAKAYAFAGRHEESVALLAALSAHRRARREDYAQLLRAQTLIGHFEDAAATVERFERRFKRKRPGREWREAVDFYKTISAPVETPEEVLGFPLPAEACVVLAASFALAKGDVVGGLVLTEALYLGGGLTAVPKDMLDHTGVVYRELLKEVARGGDWPFREYLPGTQRARFAEALVAAVREVRHSLAEYSSSLELYADIRVRAQRHYTESARAAGAGLVGAVTAAAERLADEDLLRWVTMARLRELDRGYFEAVICEDASGWRAVRKNFEGDDLRTGGEVFAALKAVGDASGNGVGN